MCYVVVWHHVQVQRVYCVLCRVRLAVLFLYLHMK
jgi:hypothetical protein